MKFGYIILYVPSVPEAISFYEAAFSQRRKFVVPTNDYGELDGPLPIAFANFEQASASTGSSFGPSPASPPPVEIAFVTDDVDAALETALKAGAVLAKAAVDKPWGQRVAYVKDINGFLVEICDAVKNGSGGK